LGLFYGELIFWFFSPICDLQEMISGVPNSNALAHIGIYFSGMSRASGDDAVGF